MSQAVPDRDDTPLFRPEAMRAQSDAFLGVIRIARPLSFGVVTAVSVLLLTAVVAFAVLGEITRKATVPGILVPVGGAVPLVAPSAGVIVEQRVAEGDTVTAGQSLFVLAADRSSLVNGQVTDTHQRVSATLTERRRALQAELDSRRQQATQRESMLADRERQLAAEQTRASEEAVLARRRSELARQSAERLAQLAREGFVSELAAQQKQEEWLDAQGRLQAVERQGLALAREAASLRAEQQAVASQWRTDQAQMARQLAALEQEDAEHVARQRVVVTAPSAGTVTAVNWPRGTMVQPGQNLATWVPEVENKHPRDGLGTTHAVQELQAALFAPSRTAGFVTVGQRVRLRIHAFPYQRFGMARGTVIAISQTPLAIPDLPAGQQQALSGAAGTVEPLFRISVEIDNAHGIGLTAPVQLKSGQSLEADIIKDRRSVWEWFIDPLLSVRPTQV